MGPVVQSPKHAVKLKTGHVHVAPICSFSALGTAALLVSSI